MGSLTTVLIQTGIQLKEPLLSDKISRLLKAPKLLKDTDPDD